MVLFIKGFRRNWTKQPCTKKERQAKKRHALMYGYIQPIVSRHKRISYPIQYLNYCASIIIDCYRSYYWRKKRNAIRQFLIHQKTQEARNVLNINSLVDCIGKFL
jgi:hypothetical protein